MTKRAQAREALLGLAEAARELRIPYQNAHRLLLLGQLQGRKVQGRWMVRACDVARLLRTGNASRP